MTDPAIDPPPAVDDVPPAPSRNDSPDVFVDKSDATLAAWPQLVQQINAIAAWMEATATATLSARDVAAGAAEEAQTTLATVRAVTSQYGERNQGNHVTPPATRNDGTPLQVADIYYNPSDDYYYVWNGE